ncbi:hypothetical protein AB6A40_002671 [Gnathostoma spinigerum]|uniref:Uncharacterized protein n=1 Tax=Gnathostoma spinigerum TaxID=75299 RepID=A0ABD6EH06_9BILA
MVFIRKHLFEDDPHPVQQKLLLPAKGIHLKDGTVFYHVTSYHLQREHLIRIAECGIRLRSGRFTEEEDEIIKKNWQDYAKKNSIGEDEAFLFVSGRNCMVDKEKLLELHRFKEETQFMPSLCEGLLWRTGRQITKRARVLFERTGVRPNELPRALQWTDEEVKKLLELSEKGWNASAIAINLGRGLNSVTYKLTLLKYHKPDHSGCKNVKPIAKFHRLRLWKYIHHKLRDLSNSVSEVKHLFEKMKSRRYPCTTVELAIAPDCNKLIGLINFDTFCFVTGLPSVDACVEQCRMEMARIRAVYEKEGYDVDSTYEKTVLVLKPMSAKEEVTVAKVIHDIVQEDVTVFGMFSIRDSLLNQRLEEAGWKVDTGGVSRSYFARWWYRKTRFLIKTSRCFNISELHFRDYIRFVFRLLEQRTMMELSRGPSNNLSLFDHSRGFLEGVYPECRRFFKVNSPEAKKALLSNDELEFFELLRLVLPEEEVLKKRHVSKRKIRMSTSDEECSSAGDVKDFSGKCAAAIDARTEDVCGQNNTSSVTAASSNGNSGERQVSEVGKTNCDRLYQTSSSVGITSKMNSLHTEEIFSKSSQEVKEEVHEQGDMSILIGSSGAKRGGKTLEDFGEVEKLWHSTNGSLIKYCTNNQDEFEHFAMPEEYSDKEGTLMGHSGMCQMDGIGKEDKYIRSVREQIKGVLPLCDNLEKNWSNIRQLLRKHLKQIKGETQRILQQLTEYSSGSVEDCAEVRDHLHQLKKWQYNVRKVLKKCYHQHEKTCGRYMAKLEVYRGERMVMETRLL